MSAIATITMTKLIFEKSDGSRVEVEATPGQSIMRTAVEHGIEGIVAECGGAAACATCHCFVIDDGGAEFADRTNQEMEMLEFTAVPAEENSRLSCQLVVPDTDEPVIVRLPERQF